MQIRLKLAGNLKLIPLRMLDKSGILIAQGLLELKNLAIADDILEKKPNKLHFIDAL